VDALYVTATLLFVVTVFVPKLQVVGVVVPESFLLQDAMMVKENRMNRMNLILFFIITFALGHTNIMNE